MVAQALFYGIDVGSLTSAALQQPIGQQKTKFCSDVASALGSSAFFEVLAGSTLVYRATISGTLSYSAAGLALPAQLSEPPTVTTANALTTNAWVRLRNSTNAQVYIDIPVKVGGDSASLTASKAHDGVQPIRTSGVLLTPPPTLDVGAAPPPGPISGAWIDVALTDMRKDPATGTYTYMNSYAVNEARPYLRTRLSYTSQYDRAQLTMNRYPNPTAFTSTNPDYQVELSYVSSGDPARTHPNWKGIIWWGGIFLSEDFAANANKHAIGYQNNTRVMIWDVQVWVKHTNGTWERFIYTDSPGGEAWYPDFRGGLATTFPDYDEKVDVNGYTSYRTTPPTGVSSDGLYRVVHPYGGLTAWSHADVAEVLCSCKSALVKHSASGPDDRQFSRFLMHNGCDYYPESYVDQSLPYYFGVGTSRCKYVKALYPNFQYHVMHTATWANLAASYPPVDLTAAPSPTPPPAPAPASWDPGDEAGLISWFDTKDASQYNTTTKVWTARYGSKTMIAGTGNGPSKITNGFGGSANALVITGNSNTGLRIDNAGFTEVVFAALLNVTSIGTGHFPAVWTRLLTGLGSSGLQLYETYGISVKYLSNPAEDYETDLPGTYLIVSRHAVAGRILRLNGSEIVAVTTTSSGTAPSSTDEFTFFGYSGSAVNYTVQVGAVGLFTAASWSTTLAQKIEGYVAHDGIGGMTTALLPVGHPYKSSAP